MRMLRVGEGTVGEVGYTTRFGGTFTDMTTHPQIIEHVGKYYSSALHSLHPFYKNMSQ
jgi:hypothetical protein